MRKSRPPLFKWRHFEPAIITCAVGWYLRFSLSYRSFAGASRTIEGYEVVHMIRKGQVSWLPKGDLVGLILFINPRVEG